MFLAGAAIFSTLPAMTSASGIVGQCADCHTMHNSKQNAPVAKIGTSDTLSPTPLPNLLRMDCIACHAQDKENGLKLAVMAGGSTVPQVYHGDSSDLAAGNFAHITAGGSRKGHDVADIFPNGDSVLTNPPGFNETEGAHAGAFALGESPLAKFTCAGASGCHGTRWQLLSANPDIPRTGLAAISGAHHNSYDGAKNPGSQNMVGIHDGSRVAGGYRFIPGLRGYGNKNEGAKWQNVDPDSHNEYYGVASAGPSANCADCHAASGENNIGVDTTLKVPSQSISGFCTTCHSDFHTSANAFSRHPADYIIPDSGEYAAYTTYEITAPVARPAVYDAASSVVTPGSDLVMCLSCHKAHATPYDAMLRFDYAAIVAGEERVGCYACHTTKGINGGA
jgi:predicted CXXCH cytochrome family protein